MADLIPGMDNVELAKMAGGLAWVVGLVLLFTAPTIGLLMLLPAIGLTAYTTRKTRERRHQELLDAARQKPEET